MSGGSLPANVKWTSALRRVPPLRTTRIRSARANEGDICAFELPRGLSSLTAESPAGRLMTIAPGDTFLGTPGHREARRWIAGGIPEGGLVPGNEYWLLSDSGLVGNLISRSDFPMPYLGRVRYLGALCGRTVDDQHSTIRCEGRERKGSQRAALSHPWNLIGSR